MNNPMVRTLLRVPQKQFKFKTPDFWRADDGEYAGHPKWDVNIFIISNAAGLEYVNADVLVSGLQEASLIVGGNKLTQTFHKPRVLMHHIALSSGHFRDWEANSQRSSHGPLYGVRHDLQSTAS